MLYIEIKYNLSGVTINSHGILQDPSFCNADVLIQFNSVYNNVILKI